MPASETAADTGGQDSSTTIGEETSGPNGTSSTMTTMTSTTNPGDADTGNVGDGSSDTEQGSDTDSGLDCEVAFVDAFEADALGDAWTIWTDGAAGEVTLSNGNAVFSIPPSDDAWVSIMLEDLAGFEDEAVIVELGAAASDPKAYVWFEVTGSTKYEFGLVDHALEVRAGSSSNPDLLVEFPYDPDAHRFLRIQSVSRAIEWAVSASGSTWETLHAVPVGDGEPAVNHRAAFGLGTRIDLARGAEASLERFLLCK